MLLLVLAAGASGTLGSVTPAAAAEQGLGEIVRALCLSAFETEMVQAGKVPPAGMADYACGCMTDRLRSGGGIDAARSACRQETALRYPI